MEKILESLIAQGPIAAVLGGGIWWLAARLKESEAKADKRIDAVEARAEACEKDRDRLWQRIAELAER